MFRIDDKETKRLEKHLGVLKDRAFPFATKETLNRTAFVAQKMYKRNIQRKLITRNKYTEQSIRVEMAKGLNIRNQMSVVGSTADYMEDQEFSGTKRKTGKHGVAITTSFASGEGRGAQPRKRLAKKKNKMRNIKLKNKKRVAKTAKQALLFKVQDAVTSGNRTIFHRFTNSRQGILRVVGGRKGFKRGWPKGAKLEMIQDLSKATVFIPKTPLLKPAYEKATKQMPRIYRDSLRYQIKKHNILK